MSRRFLILATLCFLTLTSAAKDLTGTWSGELKPSPRSSLKLVFHINPDSITMDSPDQNTYGIACETRYLSQDSVSIAVARLGMSYEGKLTEDSIIGTFRQISFSFPLNLTRGMKKINRPQTPQPPFPYTSEDVTIETPDASLAGTLTIPENAMQSVPAVVLVSGSGLQNRDEEIFGHKPFAVISDYLARHGIASLRYDDRGFGKSKGDAGNATTADFANDAEAVINYLHNTGRFSQIGLIGHSEGGMIAFILANKPSLLDFIVSIAGPSVSGAEINAYQNKVALLNSGIYPTTAEHFQVALLKALRYRLQNGPIEAPSDELLLELYPQYNEWPVSRKLAETISATLTKADINPWMEYFLRLDPAPYIKGLQIPALIIYGENDCQVPPSLNLAPAREYAPGSIIKSYPELNHMMQHAVTGNVEEYKHIEETFSEEVLSDIVSFIRGLQ